MAASLKDVMAYLIGNYSDNTKGRLSVARLVKMVYLGDWHQAINHGRQITGIEWYFDNYGPFAHDIESTVADHPNVFSIEDGRNPFGTLEKTCSLIDKAFRPSIDDRERISLDHIIKVTQELQQTDFIRLVYSTHPVLSSERYDFLNLVEKAKEYNDIKKSKLCA